MSIKEYARRVKVCIKTITNDIRSGRLKPDIITGKSGPVYDINPNLFPPKSYKRRKSGRPKGAKNKPKTGIVS